MRRAVRFWNNQERLGKPGLKSRWATHTPSPSPIYGAARPRGSTAVFADPERVACGAYLECMAGSLPENDLRPLMFNQPRLPMGAPGRDFAVIGSGVAGLSAAWLLSSAPSRDALREQDTRLGGHSHTVDVDGVPVDTGFIVYN